MRADFIIYNFPRYNNTHENLQTTNRRQEKVEMGKRALPLNL